MKKLLFPLLLIIAFVPNAFADIRLPDNMKPSPTATPQAKKMQMTIRVNSGVDEATLRIPRSAINDLRAQLDEIDGANSNAASVNSSFSKTQTLMSGLFFFVALIFGGVWLFRGKSLAKNQKIVAGLLILAFLAVSVYTVTANVAPPAFVELRGDMFSDKMKQRYRGAVGDIKVEIVDRSYPNAPIELLVPPSREKNEKSEE